MFYLVFICFFLILFYCLQMYNIFFLQTRKKQKNVRLSAFFLAFSNFYGCFAVTCHAALLGLAVSLCLGLPFFALLRVALFALSSFSQRLVIEQSERVYALIGCAHLVLHALGGVVATHTFCHLRIQF